MLRGGAASWGRPAAFLIMVGLAMTVLRWDILVYPDVINSDEDVFLACAMRYLEDPVPWRGADSSTSGPANIYALVFPMLLGAPASYVTARVLALFLAFGTIASTFAALRVLTRELSAMAAVMPMAIFFGLTEHFDYVHYSSEHLSLFLLALAVFLWAIYAESPRPRCAVIAMAGLVLGAVPFAKLQAAPFAAALILACAGAVLVRGRAGAVSVARHGGAFAGSVAIVPALVVGTTYAGGAISDFWNSYVYYSLLYSSKPLTLTQTLWLIMMTSEMKVMVLWGLTVSVMASLVVLAARGGTRRLLLQAALALAYVGLAVWVIAKPGKFFTHYNLFLLTPVTLLAGLMLGAVDKHMRTVRRNRMAPFRSFLVPLLAVGLLVVLKMGEEPENFRYDRMFAYNRDLVREASGKVLQYARPGERLGVWGWTPELYVRTGLVPAARYPVPFRAVVPGPLTHHYRSRYFRDISESSPSVFIDTTGSLSFVLKDRSVFGIHSFPALDLFVRNRYERVFSIGDDPDTAAVGYVLKSLLAERKARDRGSAAENKR